MRTCPFSLDSSAFNAFRPVISLGLKMAGAEFDGELAVPFDALK
jgi:hypothetical protein